MAWQIRFDEGLEKVMAKLDKGTAKRITSKLREIAQLEDPRVMGKPLAGNMSGLWRYRVGDYRVICHIEDGVMLILVVDIGHRSVIYKRR